jgi:hypothetical protein
MSAGFDVLAAKIMKNNIFKDVTPCSPVNVHRRFGENYCYKGSVSGRTDHVENLISRVL